MLSFDYSNTIGTQLESLQNQLNNSVVGSNGQLINSQTGGPNFVATNAIGVQSGVFRYSTLNCSTANNQWLRDAILGAMRDLVDPDQSHAGQCAIIPGD